MIAVEKDISEYIFRSATFEGMADDNGFPTDEYLQLYKKLASNGVKNIITGFTYVSENGKAVHPGQAGIDSPEKIPYFRKVTDAVHEYGARTYMQLAHAGRQTSELVTGHSVVGVSNKRSAYFQSIPEKLTGSETGDIINAFADSAFYAKNAGFDGVQLHAAHGYLIHQFIHPYLNDREDEYGINSDTGIGDRFLRQTVEAVRSRCGQDFPVLVKISASDDLPVKFSENNFISLIKVLDELKVSSIEISYGTMENALNIFRGSSVPADAVLDYNFRYGTKSLIKRNITKFAIMPFLKKDLIQFSNTYNLKYAVTAKKHTHIPVISVGGFRNGHDIYDAITSGSCDHISLCRPFICEPDFMIRLKNDPEYISECSNCNYCAVMCDSPFSTKCCKNK
jgi:2,4-dienoyl-CoA reductase-like NADH-dependent reductase (Old Yellow Enzyme family)